MLSDQLANAWPGPGVRAAFVSGGARPFVVSCLRVVISLDLAAGTRAGVNATGAAARAGSGAALAGEAARPPGGGPAANDRGVIAGIQAAASSVVPAPVNPRRRPLRAGIAGAGVFRMSW